MRLIAVLATLFIGSAAARAADRAGDFDHFILALSWSPAWCAAEDDRADAEQCRRRMGFVVHGLWPQRGDGWPEFCRTDRRDPSRRETAAMADIMGSGGLAWHAWRKHGRCADLDPAAYFAATRRAAGSIRQPAIHARDDDVRIAPAGLLDAILEVNPDLPRNAIRLQCRGDLFHEVRVCLSRALEPVSCRGGSSASCDTQNVRILSPQ